MIDTVVSRNSNTKQSEFKTNLQKYFMPLDIIFKLLKTKKYRVNIKGSQTFKKVKITSDFFSETMKARKQWKEILNLEKYFSIQNSLSVKISFKNKVIVVVSPGNHWKSIACWPEPKCVLKEVLQAKI